MGINGKLKTMVLLVTFTWGSFMTVAAAGAQIVHSTASHNVRLAVREVAMVACQGPDTLLLDVDGDRDGTLLLQYTTTNAAGAHRTIFVNWRSGDRAPSGTSLHIRVVNVPAGCGVVGSEIVVSGQPSGIIRGIPSCATGRGSSGALLEYRLCIDDAARLGEREGTTVTLDFTISDDM
jgi:hypothetical protein